MDSHGGGNGDKMNKKIGKSEQDNGDCGEDQAGKVTNYRKKVNSTKSDEPPKLMQWLLPICQVILTRCDGLALPGRSIVAVNGDGNNIQGGDSSGRISTARSDQLESEMVNSKIHKTSLRLVPKQTLGSPVSTRARVKEHMCELCSKSFEQLEHLQIHIRSHTGERPYKCEICLKSFAQKGHLERHTRTHTGERPYQCPSCSISFGNKSDVKRHLRTHTGEKPYQCAICSKSFAQSGVLKRHLQTHTH